MEGESKRLTYHHQVYGFRPLSRHQMEVFISRQCWRTRHTRAAWRLVEDQSSVNAVCIKYMHSVPQTPIRATLQPTFNSLLP